MSWSDGLTCSNFVSYCKELDHHWGWEMIFQIVYDFWNTSVAWLVMGGIYWSVLLPLLCLLEAVRRCCCFCFDFLTVQMYSICIFIIPDGPCLLSAAYFPCQDCLAADWLFDFHGGWLAPLAISLKLWRRYGMRASVWSALKCVCLKGGRVSDKGVWTGRKRVG